VLGVVSIFTYDMKRGLENLAAANVENTSLCNFDALIQLAAETGSLEPKAIAALKAFRDNPADGGWTGMLA
jgi:orotate phosphoribosyltransferase